MIEKNLAYYLTHPYEAGNIPEADLKSWEAAYPYSFGVRWLRARKSLDGLSPDASGHIAKSAAFANDLPFLHYKLMDQPEEDLDLSGFEEVKPIEVRTEEKRVESLPEKKEEVKMVKEKPLDGKRLKKAIKSVKKDEKKPIEETPISKEMEEVQKIAPQQTEKVDVETTKVEPQVPVPPKQERKEKEEEVQPTPKADSQEEQKAPTQKSKEKMVREGLQKEKKEFTTFTQWLLTLEGIERPQAAEPAKKKTKKPSKKNKSSSKGKRKKNRLEKLITNSVAEKDEAISETYAQLLERQGYSDKAEEVYRKLMLKFPEKSDYFAAKIENLDKT